MYLGDVSATIVVDGYLEALNFFTKRVDVPEVPDDPVPEGAPSGPGGGPGGSPSIPSDENPNTESNGGETQPQPPKLPEPPPRPPEGIPVPALPPGITGPPPLTLRPELHLDPPKGLNDADLAYWNALESPPALTWSDSQFILWTALTKDDEEDQVGNLINR